MTQKLSILVTDDQPAIRASLRLILEDAYQVLEAESGYATLATLEQRPVDVVILDILMPGMDGLETLRQIKQRNARVQVCMLTSVHDREAQAQAAELGAFDYIQKPFDIERVRTAVLHMERLIRGRQADGPGTNGLN